jgi:hypothetical protein
MEVTTTAPAPVRELVLVDARTGVVALHFNQVHSAKQRLTYTAGNGPFLPGALICSDVPADPVCGDAHAQGAHDHAGYTYDFYMAQHGRDGIDGAGGQIKSSVHYNSGYDNAFWNGDQMVYGDARSYPLADDVVAHELTHGVTEHESHLFYYYQSGAMNESFSDLWGELVDLTNGVGDDSAGVRWLIGEEVAPSFPGGALRNMQDPTQSPMSDPDRMTSPLYYSGEGDGGGVHSNSGVNNKAVYLMVDGGTFNGKTVSPLGIDKTADIYYEAQTNLLNSASDYQDLYDALQQACANLTGTGGITAADCLEVRDAVDAVEMNLQPVSASTVSAPVCAPGQEPADIFSDNLENPASGNWASAQLTGANRWYYPQNPNAYAGFDATYATSGQYNFWGDNPGFAADYVIAQTASTSLPAGTSYLHFSHAYGFENSGASYYDGGVVEYSTTAGASWTDAGALFTHGGYRGTLSASFGNPLGGRQAFSAQSNGYGSSRLDLSSLAGQSVRFRFRIGTDSGVADYGWFIDDVRIYTCAAATDTDGDGVADAFDNCPAVVNGGQDNGDGDASGDVCDACPATGDPGLCLDDDSDGYLDSHEALIGTGALDPCGNDGWPSNLYDSPPLNVNRVSIQDVTSFLAPDRRLGTDLGAYPDNARWDLVPGPGVLATDLNIQDLTALLGGDTGYPPMFAYSPALGKTCPVAP